MASSGSFLSSGWHSSSYGDNVYLEFAWRVTGTSVENNTSTIYWELRGVRSSTTAGYIMAGGFKVVLDEETVYSKGTDYRIKLYKGTVVASGTKTITHKPDGVRTFNVSIQGALYTFAVNVTGTATFTLDTIPRASSITATNANIGGKTTINISRAAPSFTHTLTYSFAGLTGTIETKTAKTSIQWPVPTSFYAKIPNDPSGKCTITCITYNGTTKIGESTTSQFTATAAESDCAPSVSVSAVDANPYTFDLTGSQKRIIKGYSDVEVTTTATPQKSATISSVTAICGTTKKTGATVTFSDADSATISATATDSRGYSKTADASGLTLINYINPTIVETISRESPTSNTVNISVKGNWFNGNFGAKANSLKVQVRYKPKSQTEYVDADKYVDMAVTVSGNTYTASVSLDGLLYTQAYSIQIRAIDAVHVYGGPLADPIYRNAEISKGIPVFDWGEDDFNFNVPVTVSESLTIGGVTITEAQLASLLALIK